jgi:hypothetical protein
VSGSAASGPPDRFPGFDARRQSSHWDPVTSRVVLARTGAPPRFRFFTPDEQATGVALCDQLLGQHGDQPIPVLNLIDARLADEQTDGWHYQDMPPDGEAWRRTLAALDRDATDQGGTGFARRPGPEQARLIQAVQDLGADPWHGLPAKHVWSLWTRYACTAFYSHPALWSEIGFPGPAYPRGYTNTGVDAREPFEVRDAHPGDDPVRRAP